MGLIGLVAIFVAVPFLNNSEEPVGRAGEGGFVPSLALLFTTDRVPIIATATYHVANDELDIAVESCESRLALAVAGSEYRISNASWQAPRTGEPVELEKSERTNWALQPNLPLNVVVFTPPAAQIVRRPAPMTKRIGRTVSATATRSYCR